MRKLKEEDRKRLLEYLCREPEMNLFFIGDIENYGIDTDEVNIYVWEDGEDWDCVLLRFFDFYIIYSRKETYRAADVAEFLRRRTVECISGKTGLLKQIAPFYPELAIEETLMCRCGRDSLIWDGNDGAQVRSLTAEDAPAMIELYLRIQEFAPTYRNPEKSEQRLVTDMEKGELAVGMFRDGKLVSLAKTSASNSMSAMVVGVATAPEERGKGYASAVVGELCRQAFAKKREFLCLFYDNPKAGRIYRKMGFQELGSYSMLR